MFVTIDCKWKANQHQIHTNWLYVTYDNYSMINVVSVPLSFVHGVNCEI